MSFVRSLSKLRRHTTSDAPPQWLIVGLGNPGAQYAKTKHNVGFMCSNNLARAAGVRFRSSGKDRADIAPATLDGTPAVLAQPQTYMNDSGIAVARMMKRFNLRPDRIVLIYDDVDLPFGAVRVREGGSSGGHRGVQSVLDSLQTQEVPRVRVGIGRGAGSTKDYVLTELAPDDARQIRAICDRVAEIVGMIVTDGVVPAMNRFNGRAGQETSAS